jgi:transposase
MGPEVASQARLAKVRGVSKTSNSNPTYPMTSTTIQTALSTAAKAEVSSLNGTAKSIVRFPAPGTYSIREVTAPPPLPALASGLQPLALSGGDALVGRVRDYVLTRPSTAKKQPRVTMPGKAVASSLMPSLAMPVVAIGTASTVLPAVPIVAPALPTVAGSTTPSEVAAVPPSITAQVAAPPPPAQHSVAKAAPPQGVTKSIPQTVTKSATKADIIYLGIDVHAEKQVLVLQVDATAPKPAQTYSVEKLLAFAQQQLGKAHRVVACYEAGPCGYSLCRKLIALGVKCYVVRPRCLDTFGAGVKTDARDALELCLALERYAKGNTHALSVIRLPTEAEEQRRSITRQRDALVDTRKRIAAQGRSAVLFDQHCLRMTGHWWKPRVWAGWQTQLPAHLLALLAPLHSLLLSLDTQIDALTESIEAKAKTSAARQILPKGIGELTQEVIANEVCDWHRFSNRREVSSFTGLCPREHSSGGSRRQGGINKHGNPMLRKSLCEAVWRLLQYQPQWVRFERMKDKFKTASGSRKKQLVAALARMLAIDLWRLNTGRTTLETLGFLPAPEVVTRVKRTPKAAKRSKASEAVADTQSSFQVTPATAPATSVA